MNGDSISRAALLANLDELFVEALRKTGESVETIYHLEHLAMLVKEAPAVLLAPEWVSVKDRLPKKSIISDHSVRVLISTLCGCYTAQYIFSEKLWVSDANCYVTTKKPIILKYDDGTVDYMCPPVIYDESMGVTHWMPLPEPPKEG